MDSRTAINLFSAAIVNVLKQYNLNGGKSSPRRIDVVDVVQYIWADIFARKIDWHKKSDRWLIAYARRRAIDFVRLELTARKHVRLFSDLR